MQCYKVTHDTWTTLEERNMKNITTDDTTLKNADPLYRLLYYPHEDDYLHQFIRRCVDYCERKLGATDYHSDPLIVRAFARMSDPSVDDDVLKMTALFGMMWAEPVVVEYVRKRYTCPKRLARFNACLPYWMERMNALLLSGFNIYNTKHKKNAFIIGDVIPCFQHGAPLTTML